MGGGDVVADLKYIFLSREQMFPERFGDHVCTAAQLHANCMIFLFSLTQYCLNIWLIHEQ